jgi:hypothetical protein
MGHSSQSGPAPVRAFVLLFSMLLSSAACALELGLPAQCIMGKDCFVQQYPDMDAGPGASDPFCGVYRALGFQSLNSHMAYIERPCDGAVRLTIFFAG